MRVAVLGAGLQGACVALELASRGVSVDIYDKNDRPVTQASALNEGKIHLGFFYGNDPTLNTARLLLKGALSFAPLLRRWIGSDIDRVPVSPPYYYAVHKDSFLMPDEVEAYLLACSRLARAAADAKDGDYFGLPFHKRPARIRNYKDFFNPSTVTAAFETPEVAISAETLAAFLRSHLASESNIRLVSRATVRGVTTGEHDTEVVFEVSGERFRERYDQVVNALWNGRLAVDATASIYPKRPWLFRMKYDLRVPVAPIHPGVPPVCIVLGPFGDLVRYANGEMYLSWYPAALRDTSSDLTPPDWPSELHGVAADTVRHSTFAALVDAVPALSELASPCLSDSEVKGGVIFAWGETDITDPASDLHARFDIGLHSFGSYHSIDTGKLTTAPLFAKMTADRICPT